MRKMAAGLFLTGVLTAGPAAAQEALNPALPEILPLAERAALEDAWLENRLDTVIPQLMRREGVDMWMLVAREYNEDPVVETMLPATWLAARRRTVLIFHDRGETGVERLAVARYPVGPFPSAWDADAEPDQWRRIREIIEERDPETIAVNVSEHVALADGLSMSEGEALATALGDYADRIVRNDRLGIGWLETRTEAEMEVYPTIVRIAHAIIGEGFSDAVVTPGETTAEDLVWWYRERIAGLKLDTWFHPSVNIQRSGAETFAIETMGIERANTIQRGDLLHVDFGIDYLGLKTDTQHHAYVLKEGETDAPDGLKAGLAAANAVQDALTAEFRAGRTGNEVLMAARETALAQGLNPTIYTHPIGYHGHGAGPWIGMWERQAPVPGKGEYVVRPDTAWSIELNAQYDVPEWGGQTVRFMLEEDAYFDGRTVRYLDGRQDRFHLIGASAQE